MSLPFLLHLKLNVSNWQISVQLIFLKSRLQQEVDPACGEQLIKLWDRFPNCPKKRLPQSNTTKVLKSPGPGGANTGMILHVHKLSSCNSNIRVNQRSSSITRSWGPICWFVGCIEDLRRFSGISAISQLGIRR